MSFALLFSVAIIATCGLVYELIAGALASYLLGDSITQFSLIIGVYLFSMGVGSYLSKFIQNNLLRVFIQVEFLVGLVGGVSACVLFMSFEFVSSFRILLFGFVFVIGCLVGLEIPLLMRILKDKFEFKDLVSKIFTVDYIGALFASILFPLVLGPYLGLMRTGFLFGILNVLVGLWTLYLFRHEVSLPFRLLRANGLIIAIVLLLGFVYSNKLLHYAETQKYQDTIVYKKKSMYQRIVLTQGKDTKLYLNGNLQFSSDDEYRYHEALVHPAMAAQKNHDSILVLGGGDGLAVREILKYPSVKKVTLVDLDPAMTELFTSHEYLTKLNENALVSDKVKVLNKDAFVWLRSENKEKFDLIIIDFPDPSNFSLGKLYSKSFFREIKQVLKPHGKMVIQSTSPFYARKSFWCVGQTIEETGFKISPYHLYVPSFGEWGFFIAGNDSYQPPKGLISNLKFLTLDTLKNMFVFPTDMSRIKTEVNRLNNQVLVRYFEEEWGRYL